MRVSDLLEFLEGEKVRLRAYAKINIGLRILRKRGDGYHDIETIFHRINLFDEIVLETSSTVSMSCNRHDLPTDETNLCVRAVALLQKSHNIQTGVRVTLNKNIPVGAGLGGGSSDGAAVLAALPMWWNATADRAELHKLALQLGSDVPYFLNRGTAHATGKGEVLQYFDLDVPYWIVVVAPHLPISTTWAYQHVHTSDRKPSASLKDILLEHLHEPRMLMNLVQNDFEALVLRTYPEVAKAKKALYDGGAVFAQMSGSGSSTYGFFTSQEHVDTIVQKLGPEHRVFVTPPHFRMEA